MALLPCIRCMPHSEPQVYPLENFLNYSASAPTNKVRFGELSYVHKSDSEDPYV